VQFTIGAATHDALRRLEQLLGRRLTSDDLDQALAQGLTARATEIEKRRFGASERPRGSGKPARGRHVPAAVRRAVRARDGGRCTFVAGNGRRCEARGKLEFDHVVPVARGGASTPGNLRLRCRAHNQYEAEQAFGVGFMHEARERAARERARAARARTAAGAPADLDVTPWLLRLGFRSSEARQAAARCADMTEASLEARVRAALSFLTPPARVSAGLAPGTSAG